MSSKEPIRLPAFRETLLLRNISMIVLMLKRLIAVLYCDLDNFKAYNDK
jgi:GGDEF domain-containing protein